MSSTESAPAVMPATRQPILRFAFTPHAPPGRTPGASASPAGLTARARPQARPEGARRTFNSLASTGRMGLESVEDKIYLLVVQTAQAYQ